LGLAGQLDIFNDNNPGHVLLTVAVDVREAYASSDVTSSSGTCVLDTQELSYETKYYADRQRCRTALRVRLSSFVQYRRINILLSLPDPPGDLINAVLVLGELAGEMRLLGREDPALAAKVSGALSQVLNHQMLADRDRKGER
jgi:hypothetical protein